MPEKLQLWHSGSTGAGRDGAFLLL